MAYRSSCRFSRARRKRPWNGQEIAPAYSEQNDPLIQREMFEAQVGEDVPAMRAIYVSSENITQDKLNEYADRLSVGNALVLEMKPVSGNLMWNSQAQAAANYGL